MVGVDGDDDDVGDNDDDGDGDDDDDDGDCDNDCVRVRKAGTLLLWRNYTHVICSTYYLNFLKIFLSI